MGKLKEKCLENVVHSDDADPLLYNSIEEDFERSRFDLSIEDYLDYMDKSHRDFYADLYKSASEMHSGIPHPLLETETFCKADVLSAIDYAFNQITITPEEVGVDVFKELLVEQVIAYLNQIIV